MTTVILVRHGQTAWNAVERFRGRADLPLDETGLAQAGATGRYVAARWAVSAVYSSPLQRALRTAEAIAQHFPLTVRPHAGLIDIDYGDWQGLTPDEVRARWPEALDAWLNQPHRARIPGGETLADVRERAMAAVTELTGRHTGEIIALVAHTVVNRVILLAVLGLGNERFWRLRQDTCAVNVFEADGNDYTLVALNDTCHLRAI
jgi:broad specificity phosphatase PhoE